MFGSLKKTDGFTIQELLVVLIVGSLLIGFSMSLFLFTDRLFKTWYGSGEVKMAANRILSQAALDIQQSTAVIEHTDTSFVFIKVTCPPKSDPF